jgi:undecaprenyl-diphosphatase
MDDQLLNLFNRALIHPALDAAMIALTTVGFGALLAAAPILRWRGMKRAASVTFAAQAASLLLTFIFYYLALRSRPVDVRLILAPPVFPSFPSGHAALSFATASTLVLIFRRWRLAIAIFTLAALIAYSRVYLGHHYPSDIAAGTLLGTLTAAGIYGVLWRREAHWLIWPQIGVAALVTQMAYLGILPLHLLTWPYADKVLHFLLFGAITFWLNLWLPGRSIEIAGARLPLAIVIPFAVAAFEEMLQLFSPIRTADLTDLVGDMAGMLFFYWLSWRWLERYPLAQPLPTEK